LRRSVDLNFTVTPDMGAVDQNDHLGLSLTNRNVLWGSSLVPLSALTYWRFFSNMCRVTTRFEPLVHSGFREHERQSMVLAK
jgi:hypothetical protein